MLLISARPKSISGRTSYYPARLEFLRYPQLIPACCTARGFGPPSAFRRTSPWPWIDRRVSGRFGATNALFRLAFTVASFPQELNQQHRDHSSAHSSIGTPSPRRALTLCKRTVSDTISSPSRATFQLSLTVLVHYRS